MWEILVKCRNILVNLQEQPSTGRVFVRGGAGVSDRIRCMGKCIVVNVPGVVGYIHQKIGGKKIALTICISQGGKS